MNNKNIRIKRVIQRCGCDSILPLTLVYIFYIIFHGHLSPGGGFQGGVLIVAALLLIYLGHGYRNTVKAFAPDFLHKAEGALSAGYVALALAGVAAGAQFCQNVLYTFGNRGELFSGGTVLLMNVTVGLKVVAGIGALAILILGVLNDVDVDNKKKR